MARAALPGRLTWQLGRVLALRDETPRCRSLVLELPNWPGHRAGQHVDVRLTAADGYQAQRSYSIASPPEEAAVMLTIERLEDGEVSPYLVDELRPGDELELRGPVGGYFVWEPSLGGPLRLVAGGSGVVPLRAMLRHWASAPGTAKHPAGLLYSARSLREVIYRDELMRLAADHGAVAHLALTREWPAGWAGHRGRIDGHLLEQFAGSVEERSLFYVCGPSAFVESIASTLVDLGHEAGRIRTERFGPS